MRKRRMLLVFLSSFNFVRVTSFFRTVSAVNSQESTVSRLSPAVSFAIIDPVVVVSPTPLNSDPNMLVCCECNLEAPEDDICDKCHRRIHSQCILMFSVEDDALQLCSECLAEFEG